MANAGGDGTNAAVHSPAVSLLGVVDVLITNFHLPQSTLLMLVSALPVQAIRDVRNHAIAQKYRFFSYGDAMWLDRTTHND